MNDIENPEGTSRDDPYRVELGEDQELQEKRNEFRDFKEEVCGTGNKPGKGDKVRICGTISHLGQINPDHLTPDSLRVSGIVLHLRRKLIDEEEFTVEDEHYLDTDIGEWIPVKDRKPHPRDRIDSGCQKHFYEWARLVTSTVKMFHILGRKPNA